MCHVDTYIHIIICPGKVDTIYLPMIKLLDHLYSISKPEGFAPIVIAGSVHAHDTLCVASGLRLVGSQPPIDLARA